MECFKFIKYFFTINFWRNFLTYAVILSGGIGTRTGLDIPKQFLKINDKPLLAYCIEKFIQFYEFKKIIVSSPKEYLDKTKELINTYFPNENRLVVIAGGKTRQDTLMNSVYYINHIDDSNPIVINHDAARIFVSTEQISECIKWTNEYGAASPMIPSTDVIVEMKDNSVSNMPNRFDLVHIQTPQGFRLNEYLDLFNSLTDEEIEGVHEIVSVYFMRNKEVYLFNGEKSNFKVTDISDVELAKFILRK